MSPANIFVVSTKDPYADLQRGVRLVLANQVPIGDSLQTAIDRTDTAFQIRKCTGVVEYPRPVVTFLQ